MNVRFGTGGWRAVIGDGFTRQNVELLAAALAQAALEEPAGERGVAVGYDRRFLSKEAAYWAAQVLAGAGVPCLLIDREAPTPLVMFAVDSLHLPYGMAVTASHNPAVYNGVKLFTHGGRDADARVTAALEARMESLEGEPPPRAEFDAALETGMISLIDPMNA